MGDSWLAIQKRLWNHLQTLVYVGYQVELLVKAVSCRKEVELPGCSLRLLSLVYECLGRYDVPTCVFVCLHVCPQACV